MRRLNVANDNIFATLAVEIGVPKGKEGTH